MLDRAPVIPLCLHLEARIFLLSALEMMIEEKVQQDDCVRMRRHERLQRSNLGLLASCDSTYLLINFLLCLGKDEMSTVTLQKDPILIVGVAFPNFFMINASSV